MKYRNGFVTNSSSSSFICDICGREEAEMYECINGHIFCNDEMPEVNREDLIKSIFETKYINLDTYKHYTKEELEDMETDELLEIVCEDSNVPECVCPICNFDEYLIRDMRKYLLKEYKIPEEDVFDIIKEKNRRRKKLYDVEYITYVCQEKSLDLASIVKSWKERFNTYTKFAEYIN